MKKQLFTLMMAFALVLGLSVSANAQGLYPTSGLTYEMAIGSSGSFSVDSLAGNTYAWDVYELALGHVVGAPVGASVNGTKVTVANPTWARTDINFYAMPTGVFVVQVTETETATGVCSTIRRFYVSLFDFDIQVIALDVNQASTPGVPNAARFASADTLALASCNSWSGNVIKNNIDAAMIAALRADSVNNPTDGEFKYTDSYFAVRVTIDGANFQTYQSRFQWSFDSIAGDPSIYQVAIAAGVGAFAAEGGTNILWEPALNPYTSAITRPDTWAGGNFATNQTIYVPKQASAVSEVFSVIRVRTHNLAGAPDMRFAMKIDRLQLEKDTNGGPYNNGQKIHNATIASNSLTNVTGLNRAQDTSASITVRQAPATRVISVVD